MGAAGGCWKCMAGNAGLEMRGWKCGAAKEPAPGIRLQQGDATAGTAQNRRGLAASAPTSSWVSRQDTTAAGQPHPCPLGQGYSQAEAATPATFSFEFLLHRCSFSSFSWQRCQEIFPRIAEGKIQLHCRKKMPEACVSTCVCVQQQRGPTAISPPAHRPPPPTRGHTQGSRCRTLHPSGLSSFRDSPDRPNCQCHTRGSTGTGCSGCFCAKNSVYHQLLVASASS